jgi:uncharacterized protein (DUF1697 family)
MPKPAPLHVALLRGINVGGKNLIPMVELTALFETAGARELRTYIQSGNVVFAASAADAPRIAERVRLAIARQRGFETPVVLRSAADWRAALEHNPFLAEGADPRSLHVAFLADEPSRARAAALDPRRSPGDRFQLLGRELYLHLPNGVARSKLTNAWIDRSLSTTSTLRNWRTVEALGVWLAAPRA